MIFELILLTPTALLTTYLFSPVLFVIPVSVGITTLETKSPSFPFTFNCNLILSSSAAPNLNPSITCGGGASLFVNPSKYNLVDAPTPIVLSTSSER